MPPVKAPRERSYTPEMKQKHQRLLEEIAVAAFLAALAMWPVWRHWIS